jgi:hypothetical protein
MERLSQRSLVLLILLLPSQVVCGICSTGWCSMQAGTAAVETAAVEAIAPSGCHHQLAEPDAVEAVIAAATVRPDCCTAVRDARAETPVVLTASATALTIEAAGDGDVAPGVGAPVRPRWTPPAPSEPLYRLHGSLLI